MAGKLFWFLTDYAGGPLIGSGPLGWRPGFGTEKTGVSFEGTVKTAAPRGGGGWAPPTRPQPGCARLRACFGGAVGPAKTPPPPPAAGLPLGLQGGGGVWRPRGAFGPPGPAKPKSPGRGLGIFRAHSAPPPPPRGGLGGHRRKERFEPAVMAPKAHSQGVATIGCGKNNYGI